ncbi:peptidoglycan-binding protein [Streptococcus sp. 121]|uniref:peptidoglycan-binding protein n=1 Tax=Streptococcus sp. 121 TaxID=2797637 RepID=UPI0018F0FEF7|nr:peptidoglycan-binding protein [Streptococcus sp. 121]MBJ6745733.1 peptidoglycan-binding protein [Streptococcus sp. 121]
MRKEQKQKYRNFGILTAASALVIGGTVLAENYTGSKEIASSTIEKKETVSSSTVYKASSSQVKSSSKREVKVQEETATSAESKVATEVELLKANPSSNSTETTQVTALVDTAENHTYTAPASLPVAQVNSSTTAVGSIVLANGNTAGEHGQYAAARMAELTGVSAATWENIIARESNGDIYAANASGASGLFQTMPGWGSTASVEDQIQAAYNAYSNQGLAAWGY